jgi:pimeloyl-ACP methyl ester carboxylesterase
MTDDGLTLYIRNNNQEKETMRKITILSMITLDGVMQAPGGPQEDTSGGFNNGGWRAPYWSVLIVLIFIAGCSFNKTVLHPTKYLKTTTNLPWIDSNTDTLCISLSGNNHQPTMFRKNCRDTVKLSFKIESVLFINTEGDTLNGWLLRPKNQNPTITLLQLHGNAGSLYNYLKMSSLLKYGFQLFMFDYSGFGFSQGKSTRDNILSDALSAFDYLKTRNEIKGTRLVIYGQSLGGNLAPVVASKRQNEIDGLVVEGGFSSYKDMAAKSYGFVGRILMAEKYNAMKSIKAYRKPLLSIHSREDQTVPFDLGRKLFDNANEPKTFFEINKPCHLCALDYYSEEISQKIKNMLRK